MVTQLTRPMNKKILFIEDEEDFAAAVTSYLKRKGFDITLSPSARRALTKIKKEPYDLVILDLGLPDEDGLKLCEKIRKNQKIPILILTARDAIRDRVTGLNAGADDYLVKPIPLKELTVRIDRLLNRDLKNTFRSSVFGFSGIKFDTVNRVLHSDSKAVPLTKKESAVLEYLLLHQGRVLSRMDIMDHVWGNDIDLLSNTVNMVISSLRKKLEKFSTDRLIYSVHGLGYKLEVGSD